MINDEIQKHYDIANDLAIKEVERLARLTLKKNPKQLHKFMMAMGSFFFIDNNDDIIHTMVGGNESMLKELEGYNDLVDFVDKWDEDFKLTGQAMTFTAEGKLIDNW